MLLKLRCNDWTCLLESVIIVSHSIRGGYLRKLAFLLLPEFSHLGLAAAIEPLFIANWLSQERVFDWTILSVDGNAVRASNGMTTAVDGDLAAAPQPRPCSCSQASNPRAWRASAAWGAGSSASRGSE